MGGSAAIREGKATPMEDAVTASTAGGSGLVVPASAGERWCWTVIPVRDWFLNSDPPQEV